MKALFVRLFTIGLICACLAANQFTIGQLSQSAAVDSIDPHTELHIVRFWQPALASYSGGIDGYLATSPTQTKTRKLNTDSPASLAYNHYLESEQNAFIADISQAFGRSIDIVYRYTNVLNALAISISRTEAKQIERMPGILAVYSEAVHEPDTDVGPEWIGADDIWNGTATGTATKGEGIIIGMIDTGIDHTHPAFADPAPDGYKHTNPWGAGNYGGICAPTHPNYDPNVCNDKLIAAYNFHPLTTTTIDVSWHGSHTASTAAGNTEEIIYGGVTRTISGVAPHANLIAYKVCHPHGDCRDSAILAAINQAVTDGVDVLNYSISGGDDPWNDPIELAFLDAYNAGIYVSTSAGNAGPGANTVAHTAPWEASVAMSTHTRVFAKTLDIIDPYNPSLQDLAAIPTNKGPEVITDTDRVITYDPINLTGCTAFPANFFDNMFALIQTSTDCTDAVRINAASDAGAAGVVLFNDRQGPPPIPAASGTSVPALMLGWKDGLTVRNYIDSQFPFTVTARMNATTQAVTNPAFADMVEKRSSRGPSDWDILKPDYAAPGVRILAAGSNFDPYSGIYLRGTGTSMASPHNAGAAALLISLHPNWSPSAIQSALTTTTRPWWDIKADDILTVTASTPLDTGSGRLKLNSIDNVGLVLEETYQDFLAANPNQGGDIKALNLPGLVDHQCAGVCTWQRTFTNVLTETASYHFAFISTVPTLTLTTAPSNFTIASGAPQAITFTVDVTSLPVGQPIFGSVLLVDEAAGYATQHLTMAVTPSEQDIPMILNIDTDRKNGSYPLIRLISAKEILTLTTTTFGLTFASPISTTLPQDPTPDDPFDAASGVFTYTFQVPMDTLRLVTEVISSTAETLLIHAGSGITPSLATRQCVSVSTQTKPAICDVDIPPPGDYWLLVQNLQASGENITDTIKMNLGLVTVNEGNLFADGPSSVGAYQTFGIELRWNEPLLQPDQRWYGLIQLGTQPDQPVDIGTIKINLRYHEGYAIFLPLIIR